jgi:hypothetical protein
MADMKESDPDAFRDAEGEAGEVPAPESDSDSEGAPPPPLESA